MDGLRVIAEAWGVQAAALVAMLVAMAAVWKGKLSVSLFGQSEEKRLEAVNMSLLREMNASFAANLKHFEAVAAVMVDIRDTLHRKEKLLEAILNVQRNTNGEVVRQGAFMQGQASHR